MVLATIVAALNPSRLFEFGTFDGRTTCTLALNARPNAITYTLDVERGWAYPPGDPSILEPINIGGLAMGRSDGARVVFLTGDSQSFDFRPYVGSVDLLFVDADHSYQPVISDSENAIRMLRRGETIFWHDYLVIDDVTRAMVELNTRYPLSHLQGTSFLAYRS